VQLLKKLRLDRLSNRRCSCPEFEFAIWSVEAQDVPPWG